MRKASIWRDMQFGILIAVLLIAGCASGGNQTIAALDGPVCPGNSVELCNSETDEPFACQCVSWEDIEAWNSAQFEEAEERELGDWRDRDK